MRLNILSSIARQLVLPCLAMLTACSTAPLLQEQKLQTAWLVKTEQGQTVARVITEDTVCPSLLQDGVASIMQQRAVAGTMPQRKTASPADKSKASVFPVLTCDATLHATTQRASIDGHDLPVPKPVIRKIVVIGDTGCRLKSNDDYFQSCNDSEKWAFRTMANTAASFNPDLVVHVGDYHYRENACPEGNKECAGSPWGYGWDTWQADFFAPAAALLKAAPWVVVRGNHESCARAGQGWWRFMDPRPLQKGRDCNLEQYDLTGDYSPPYAVPLGKLGDGQAQLLVFDSSKAPGKALAKDEQAYQIYKKQFGLVNQLSEGADFNIFLSHHPVLGLAAEKKKSGGLDVRPGNPAMQGVMQDLNASRLFPAGIQVALAGHVHLFEALTFSSNHPVQFVSGNGGSSLDMAIPTPLAAGATPYPGAHTDFFSNSNEVGFTLLERDEQGWKIQAWNKQGKLMTQCQVQDKKNICKDFAH
ncbi:metallophosphoesterase [Undibacterium sp. TS12]|uniref:metallophosphoesterase n=1 Tax=Undibacterium sp. TS12 TaxID=2908202 RepID=UPI001F4CD00F|nr:metallophosphoesterase [Undibacterium sp. TS12]MCH8618093.1 metallophosphoesterase [Undibacterium sp. TS12]